jgi:hypothetical protein
MVYEHLNELLHDLPERHETVVSTQCAPTRQFIIADGWNTSGGLARWYRDQIKAAVLEVKGSSIRVLAKTVGVYTQNPPMSEIGINEMVRRRVGFCSAVYIRRIIV